MTTVLLLLLTTAATVVLNCPSHVSPVEARTLLSLKSTSRSFSIPRRNSFGLVVSSSSSSSIKTFPEQRNINYFLTNIRGGGSADSDDNDEDDYEEEEDDTVSVKVAVEDANNDTDENNEYDSEEEEEEEEEEYDSESEEDEDSTTTSTINPFGAMLKSSILSKSNNNGEERGPIIMEYDELLTPPPMQQMGITIGVMLLSNRIDIHNSRAIKIARFAFLSYIITVQIFLLYVNWQAKRLNDRTPIKIGNPLMSMLPPGLLLGGSGGGGGGGGGTNFMIQTLANQLLSSSTTVLEYDMKQMKKMNGSLLFPMILLYFLHFKMKQVQPLLMQTATGFANLIYSPLFQVYILGRNLERPFKPPVTTNPMMEALMKQQSLGGASAVSGEGSVDEEDEDDDEDDDDESSGDGDTEEEDGVVVEEI